MSEKIPPFGIPGYEIRDEVATKFFDGITLTYTEAEEIRFALTRLVKAKGSPEMADIGNLVLSLKMFAPMGRYGNKENV